MSTTLTFSLRGVEGVLWAPAPGDVRLLRSPPCGGRMPIVGHFLVFLHGEEVEDLGWRADGGAHPHPLVCAHPAAVVVRPRSALPLWWEGAVLPESMDRANRVCGLAPHHLKDATLQEVAVTAITFATQAGGVVILVDAHGRETWRHEVPTPDPSEVRP